MSKSNPTNPNEEYRVTYPDEGGAHGGDYASLDIARGVACERLGWDPKVATTNAHATRKGEPREWTLKHPSGGKVQIVEVL